MNNIRFSLFIVALWASFAHAGGPLYDAVAEKNYEKVVQLLKEGAKVEGFDSDATPLHIAAFCGYVKMVSILLKHNAAVNAKDFWERTPLYLAIGHVKTMKLLLKHGADPTMLNYEGYSPLHHAVKKGFARSVELLLSHDKTLVNQPCDERSDHKTPLHIASVTQKRTAMIRRLIAHGASVDSRNRFHETPLHLAACKNNKKNIQLLLDNGAEITAQTHRGETVLHAVCYRQWFLNREENAKQTKKAKKAAILILANARAQGKEDELLSLKGLKGQNAHDFAKNNGDNFLIPLTKDVQKTNPAINKIARKVKLSSALKKHTASNILQLIRNRELGIR